jgi:hypothetical protein
MRSTRTSVSALVAGPLLLTAALAAVACGGDSKLDVQVAKNPAQQPAAAPAEGTAPPAAQPADASGAPAAGTEESVPMMAGHAPSAAAGSQPVGAVPPEIAANVKPEDLPPGHPAIGGASTAPGGASGMQSMGLAPVNPDAGTGEAAIAWTPPAGWKSVTPSTSMRRAQYQVTGPAGDAECAVFYFGPGQGGDPMANAERWASQFVGPDGKPAMSSMKTHRLEANGAKILVVEAKGTYMAGNMMGGPSEPKQGYGLLGAVVEGPDANWFFKMTGPEATVFAQREAFDQMLRTIRRGG